VTGISALQGSVLGNKELALHFMHQTIHSCVKSLVHQVDFSLSSTLRCKAPMPVTS
jgi:hypothetical protein